MVHRLLAASLGLQPLPDSARDRAGVRAVADNLNVRHRNAQMAGRASVELHTLIFFKGRTVVADARITRVSQGSNCCQSSEAWAGSSRVMGHEQQSHTGYLGVATCEWVGFCGAAQLRVRGAPLRLMHASLE